MHQHSFHHLLLVLHLVFQFQYIIECFHYITIGFFSYCLPYFHFYLFLNKIKYLITSRRTKNSSQPLPFRRFFCLNNFFYFLTILPSLFFQSILFFYFSTFIRYRFQRSFILLLLTCSFFLPFNFSYMDPKSSLWTIILLIQFLLDNTSHFLSISFYTHILQI